MNLQTPSTQRTGTEGQALYGHRSSPPRRLIQPNGEYAAGWFNHFSGELNFKDSRARQRRLQRWFHLQFETETHFIVANIAHLGLAGDTTILVMHKETGDIKKASKTSWLWSNPVAVDAKCSSFFNGKSDSSIVQRDNGEVIFSIQVETRRPVPDRYTDPCLDRPLVEESAWESDSCYSRWSFGSSSFPGGAILGKAEFREATFGRCADGESSWRQ